MRRAAGFVVGVLILQSLVAVGADVSAKAWQFSGVTSKADAASQALGVKSTVFTVSKPGAKGSAADVSVRLLAQPERCGVTSKALKRKYMPVCMSDI